MANHANDKFILDEYQYLRDEINTHFKIVNQYMLTTMTATWVIIGAAFSIHNPDPLLFLAPLLIIIPSAFNYASRNEALIKIGTYIVAFVEEGEGRNGWESRQPKWGDRIKHLDHNSFLNRFFYTSAFPGFGVACLFLYARACRTFGISEFLFVAIPLIVLAIAVQRIISAPSKHASYLQAWRQVRDSEQRALTIDQATGASHEPSTSKRHRTKR